MILKNLSRIWSNEPIKKKILFTLGIVAIYKLLAVIPVPGVNIAALANLEKLMQANQGLGFFSALMGGGLKQFSIILMGLSPYINATIIIQLLGVVIPQLEALKKEGASGQKKIDQYTRWLTLPLALAQSYGMILLLNTLLGSGVKLINTSDFIGTMLPAMIMITAGTLFLMWLGEIINESGIGNGSSLIIFAGVLAGVPTNIVNYISTQSYVLLAVLAALTLGVIYVIIRFTEGYRKIPLVYTRTGRYEKSYFPIRVNQSGMVPIIFAVSIVTFPSLIGQVLMSRAAGTGYNIGEFLVTNFSMNNPSWAYIVVYFALIIGFSFFYVSIVFNTDEVAESIQKRGGYIPGVRPGKDTAEYLGKTSSHLNFFGGAFLALIAVFPYVITKINDTFGLITTTQGGRLDFLINGASLIIVVGVVLDLIRKVDADLKSFDYKRFH